MGDAGIPTPLPGTHIPTSQPPLDLSQTQPREVHILVTGFGAFKSFTNNPSYLIASALPQTLPPATSPSFQKETTNSQSQPLPPTGRNSLSSFFNRHLSTSSHVQTQPTLQPLRSPNKTPYIIRIHVYPDPVYVSYTPTSILIPSLLNPATNGSVFPGFPDGIDFDYVLHIGLASGRDSYTLETLAHRDDYLIPDVDEGVGSLVSDIWRREGIPSSIDIGWDGIDVLRRWTAEVDRREQKNSSSVEEVPAEDLTVRRWRFQQGILPHPSTSTTPQSGDTNTNASAAGSGTFPRRSTPRARKPVVKLSRDAGRFLCEFILMCSLVYRWKEAQTQTQSQSQTQSQTHDQTSITPLPHSKLGKVAFLHVPNGTDPSDVARGAMVAESAIRAVVGSWEAGWRNPSVYEVIPGVEGEVAEGQDKAEVEAIVREGGFEEKGTGDEIGVEGVR